MVPGRKFSSTTSARAMRARRISCPSGGFMLSVRLFLLRLTDRKYVASPAANGGHPRVSSPLPGSSTLMTSAPMSPRDMAANGPASTRVRSMTRMPASGPRERAGRGRGEAGRRALRLAVVTGPPFPQAFDEALADGRHLLAAIARPAPEQPRSRGEAEVGEVEHRVHVLHRHPRADLDAAGLLPVAEQPGPALELDDGDVQRRAEPLGRR